jgi:hypothetical protein
MEGLGGQGVARCSPSEAHCSGLHPLSFLAHVHTFDPTQGLPSGLARFAPHPGPCHPLYTSLLLLHDGVSVWPLPEADGGAVCLVLAFERSCIGRALLDAPPVTGRGIHVAATCLPECCDMVRPQRLGPSQRPPMRSPSVGPWAPWQRTASVTLPHEAESWRQANTADHLQGKFATKPCGRRMQDAEKLEVWRKRMGVEPTIEGISPDHWI